jgi:UDP-N-acetylglucosamine 1-carboxyvinyltransferase
MDAFEIQGPAKLEGVVPISGSKNSTLPIIFSTLMCEGPVNLKNVPDVVDIYTTQKVFCALGLKWNWDGPTLFMEAQKVNSVEAPYDLVKKMRASVLCLGPLLARYGEAKVSFPGGCAIGARPINLHLDAFQKMGATVDISQGYVHAKAKRLKGAHIIFPKITVTGTANVICAAVLAEGETLISNAALEPEVIDLCHFLRACGAKIQGDGSNKITVQGIEKLGGATHEIMHDRIEFGTYAILAAATQSRLTLEGNFKGFGESVLAPLRQAGVLVTFQKESQEVYIDARENSIKPVSIKTMPYPGFATDLQAQWMALMTQATGPSVIHESVFENRFLHAAELSRMGAKIEIQDDSTAEVTPTPQGLTGTDVMATDLRASACLVIAGLIAKGTTRVRRIYHLDRGYEHMEKKLCEVGADIKRVNVKI